MRFLGVIPARYASTRFPGKPLAMIHGKSMIQRVYEQATKSTSLSSVVVATDDQRIFDHVRAFGGQVVMTSSEHPSGTDRCLEAYEKFAAQQDDFEVVINIQGDEPYIQPEQIDQVAALFTEPETAIATLVKPTTDPTEIQNPNVVKAVRSIHGQAIYFSRFPLPFLRNKEEAVNHLFFKHIGIYAYRTAALKAICALPKSSLEIAESLEQLRWIENGYKIQTGITHFESNAVDSPEDLLKFTNKS